MKIATLPQMRRLIELFENTPYEQVQAVFTSGLLTDVRDANYSLLTSTNRDSIRELLGLPRLTSKSTVTAYVVDINFATLTEGIALGKYDWKNGDITTERFPIAGNQGKKEVFTVHFNRTMESSEAVIAELDKLGYKPAETADLLALGKDQLELQRQFPIIALGSSAVVHGSRYVPYLYEYVSERRLSLYYFHDGWYDDCRFLAVRK
jgi:hypothetical protein